MKILGTITVETIIVDTFILLIVCSIIILLHVKKIRTLRNSLAVTDQTQRRMNIVVTVIISTCIIIICIVSLV